MKKFISSAAMCILCLSANAEGVGFGKWRVFGENSNDPPSALTSNDSDNAFGQVCAEDMDGCFWLILSPNTPCVSGAQAPILLNSSGGSMSFTALCVGVFELGKTKYHRYAITPFDDVAKIVKDPSIGRIAFAIPIDGGMFTVVRFDLEGARKAIGFLDGLKARYFRKRDSKSTKDISL